MAVLQEYKCPCCGGAIAFDSSLQKMKCPYCDTEFEMETLASYDNELKNEPAENMTWNDVAGAEWQDRETEGLLSYCRVSTDAEDQINSYRAQVSYYRQKHLVLSNIIDCSIPSRRHIEKAL